MREIEVKAKVKNWDMLITKLDALGVKLSPPIHQHDTIYVDGDWEFTQFVSDRNILRIRRQGDKSILTLKRPGKNELDCTECETEVSNPESTHKMLKLMGYRPFIEVKKERRKAKYGGLKPPHSLLENEEQIEICLDRVEDLGEYIEVEKLTKDNNVEKIQQELFSFLETLGISKSDQETHGYDTLMRLKQLKK